MQDLPQADSNFNKPGKIDLLISCNAFQHVFKLEARQGDSQHSVAVKPLLEQTLSHTPMVGNVAATASSDDLLKRFWETEELIEPPLL